MPNLIILVACIFTASVAAARGGFGVGNGGGFAQCANGALYAYDYLLSKAEPTETIESSLPAEERLAGIARELHRLGEPLADDFDLFFRNLFKEEIGAKYQWLKRANMHPMYEPHLDQSLPADCRKRFQAILYFAPMNGLPHATYGYHHSLIQEVRRQSGGELQVSFLLVHEWLWNFSDRDDFETTAAFNRLLQSDRLKTLSPDDYKKLRPMLD